MASITRRARSTRPSQSSAPDGIGLSESRLEVFGIRRFAGVEQAREAEPARMVSIHASYNRFRATGLDAPIRGHPCRGRFRKIAGSGRTS